MNFFKRSLFVALLAWQSPFLAQAQSVVFLQPDLTQGQDRSGVVVSEGSFGGVAVQILQPGSPFAAAGIQRGDEIVKVGSRPTPYVADFYRAVNAASASAQVEVQVRRSAGIYGSYWVQLASPAGTSAWDNKNFRSQYKSGGQWVKGTTILNGSNGRYQLDQGKGGQLYQITYRDQGQVAEGLWRFDNGSIGWFSFRLNGDQRSFNGDWGMGTQIGQNKQGPWEGKL